MLDWACFTMLRASGPTTQGGRLPPLRASLQGCYLRHEHPKLSCGSPSPETPCGMISHRASRGASYSTNQQGGFLDRTDHVTVLPMQTGCFSALQSSKWGRGGRDAVWMMLRKG